MSLRTWKKEFYPFPAWRTVDDEAVEHSARKWRGVLPENLEKHGLVRTKRIVHSDDVDNPLSGDTLILDSDTCALCKHHFEDNSDLIDEADDSGDQDPNRHDCPECPIVKNGHWPCEREGSLYKNAVAPDLSREESEERVLALIEAIEGKKPE